MDPCEHKDHLFKRRRLARTMLLLPLLTTTTLLVSVDVSAPFASCGAGEAGIEVLQTELDSPFGLEQWCCGNTTWSSFSWRAKATRNVDFTVGKPAPDVPGGLSNASMCEGGPEAGPDCFSFCFNTSAGGPCLPPNGPTGPVPAGCQAALDAVCAAPANTACVNATTKASGAAALPLVGAYGGGCYNTTGVPKPLQPMWHCYSRTALDPTHKHWNGVAPIPIGCGECSTSGPWHCWPKHTLLRDELAAVLSANPLCQSVKPGAAAYPADTWTAWHDFRPDTSTTSRKNKNASSTIGAWWCEGYPNTYLDPIQHLVMEMHVGGVFTGNSTNVTMEIRPIKPAGATYQITAMIAPITGLVGSTVFNMAQPGMTNTLSILMMLARENLTKAASHLGPRVSTSVVRPLLTQHEHNSMIFQALPQNKRPPKLIQVVQGFHMGNNVESWLEGARALVGFGATGLTAAASAPGKEIFDAAGVVAARVNGGLHPISNATSHVPLESCNTGILDNGHCWGHTDAEVAANLKLWAEAQVSPLRALGFKTLTQFSLHDELGWAYPGIWAGDSNISANPRVFKRFQTYIKKSSGLTTPQAFGAASWNKVVPITFANITKGVTNEQALRVRAYWSIRFAAVDVVQFYSKATQALIAANGGESFSIYTNTNNFHGRLFTPGLPHVQPGTGVVTQTADRGGMDWMQAGRYKAGIDMPSL
jgi:hypothetical protein